MFQYLKSVSKHTTNKLDFNQLVEVIKTNPNKEEITYLHSVEYKSSEYKKIKKQFPCVKIHGLFNGLGDIDVLSINEYLYFDIDNLNVTQLDLNVTIDKLKDTFPFISLITKSIGGRGIFFLVRVEGLTIENHRNVWMYMVNEFFSEFNIDRNAYSLNRSVFIPYDEDIYVNNEVSFRFDLVSLNNFINELNNVKDIKTIKTNIKNIHYELNVTFDIIPFDVLLKQINIETLYTKEIEGTFTVDEMNYYRILIPERILDGTKHKIYARIINGLFYINPEITLQQLLSYIFYVNERATPKMDYYSLKKYTTYIYNRIIETGEVYIKPRIKKIHFNKMEKLTAKQRMSMGAKINGALKTNKTIQKIEEAKEYLLKRNEVITQKRIAEVTGLNLRTIKRNWNKEEINIQEIKPIVIEVKEPEFNIINEEDFFNKKETEIINYKGFKDVEIDKVSVEDKKLFISKINELKQMNLEPSEELIYDLNIFSKEKSWYLYNKWRQSNPYPIEQ
jgi:hypothetical protein